MKEPYFEPPSCPLHYFFHLRASFSTRAAIAALFLADLSTVSRIFPLIAIPAILSLISCFSFPLTTASLRAYLDIEQFDQIGGLAQRQIFHLILLEQFLGRQIL